MMLNTISREAWDRVRKEHPEVWAYLIHESLKGELKHLQMEPNPNDWQKSRLKELTVLFAREYELALPVSRDRKVNLSPTDNQQRKGDYYEHENQRS